MLALWTFPTRHTESADTVIAPYLTQLLQQAQRDARPARLGPHVQVLQVEGASRPAGVGAVAHGVPHHPTRPLRYEAEEPRRGALETVFQ